MRAPPPFRLLSTALSREVSTIEWPEEAILPEGPPRGIPVVDPAACTACGACVTVCPSGCLSIEEGEGQPVVDTAPCVRCGICVGTCPEQAITLSGARDLASYSRMDMVKDGEPPGEVPTVKAPSALYRRATVGSARTLKVPGEILQARSSALDARKKKGGQR